MTEGHRAASRGCFRRSEVILDQLPSETPSPEDSIIAEHDVQSFLESLKETVLRGILVKRLEGYTNDEIANNMGMTTRTVERRLATIRRIYSDSMGGAQPHPCGSLR